MINIQERCNSNTAHFSFRNNLYRNIFPIKLMTKNTIIASNQVALYIHIRAVSVLYQLSMKVPKAMAIAKTINKTDINRVEKKNFLRSSVIFGRRFDSSVQKYIF